MEPAAPNQQTIQPSTEQPTKPEKCWRGSGWFTAAWIKFLSSDQSVAASIYNRLLLGSMDAETLRWFSPAQLELVEKHVFHPFEESAEILDNETKKNSVKIKSIFEKSLSLAKTMGHSSEKQAVLTKICDDLQHIEKGKPEEPGQERQKFKGPSKEEQLEIDILGPLFDPFKDNDPDKKC